MSENKATKEIQLQNEVKDLLNYLNLRASSKLSSAIQKFLNGNTSDFLGRKIVFEDELNIEKIYRMNLTDIKNEDYEFIDSFNNNSKAILEKVINVPFGSLRINYISKISGKNSLVEVNIKPV